MKRARATGGLRRAVADHIVHHSAELRTEPERGGPAYELDLTQGFRRGDEVRLRVAVGVGGNVVAILPNVHLDRLSRVEAAESDTVGGEAGPLRLGHIEPGNAAEDLAGDVLRGVHVQAVQRKHLGLLPSEDGALQHLRQGTHGVGRCGGAGDRQLGEPLRLALQDHVQADHRVRADSDGAAVGPVADGSDLQRVPPRSNVIEAELAQPIGSGVAVRPEQAHGSLGDRPIRATDPAVEAPGARRLRPERRSETEQQ